MRDAALAGFLTHALSAAWSGLRTSDLPSWDLEAAARCLLRAEQAIDRRAWADAVDAVDGVFDELTVVLRQCEELAS